MDGLPLCTFPALVDFNIQMWCWEFEVTQKCHVCSRHLHRPKQGKRWRRKRKRRGGVEGLFCSDGCGVAAKMQLLTGSAVGVGPVIPVNAEIHKKIMAQNWGWP